MSVHPLDQEQAVAEAWQQPAWADYSGVSRTLSSLSQASPQQRQQIQAKRAEGADQVHFWQEQVEQLAADYQKRGPLERPHSAVAKARRKLMSIG